MMNNIDLTYILPLVALLLSFFSVLLLGKKAKNISEFKWTKYLPLLSVIIFLSGVLYITYYYENQLKIEKENFKILEKKLNLSDNIFLSNESKNKTLDSLILLKTELNRLLIEVKKQEKIIGTNSNITSKISDKISNTSNDIGLLNSYNEIIPVRKNLKGYTTRGNSSNFVFNCPVDLSSEYLDLQIYFPDAKLIPKIAYIMISVYEVKEDEKNYQLFSQDYKPKNGINTFKIRNYLKNKNVEFAIGYILKSELNEEYPTFEKISCTYKI